ERLHDRARDHGTARAPRRADLGDAGPLPRAQPGGGQEAHVDGRRPRAGDARALPVLGQGVTMATRVAIVAVAIAGVVVAATRLHRSHECNYAAAAAVAVLYFHEHPGTPGAVRVDPQQVVDRLLSECDDHLRRAEAVAALVHSGAISAADRLARAGV